MKIIRLFFTLLIVISLLFISACQTTDDDPVDGNGRNGDAEDPGVDDVFEDPGNIDPPQVPG